MTSDKTAPRDAPEPSGPAAPSEADPPADAAADDTSERPAEYGGPKGPEPTRYGDWERKGICVDF